MNINSISGLNAVENQSMVKKLSQPEEQQPSFKDTLKGFLNEVNELQQDSKVKVEQFLNGEITDIHEVMIAAEKASVSLQLTVAIRNKLMDAFQQIMRLS